MISNIIRNYSRKEDDGVKPYLEFKSSTPMTITPKYQNSGITLQYSLNKATWKKIASNSATPSSNTIYFRGRATGTKSLFTDDPISNAWSFTGATNLEVHGDITMLLQDTLGGMVRDIPLYPHAFAYMFYKCTSLTTAPSLPSTTLASGCYSCMFESCTSLTTPPSLPATTLGTYCYRNMLRDCTSLTTLPSLPATTLPNNCYAWMFAYSTKIKLSTTKTGNYQTEYRLPTSGTGSGNASTMDGMFYNTGGTFTSRIDFNTTYYTENQVI